MRIDPDKVDVFIDREQAFLLYATFCGDLERTAHALNITPVMLLKMVDEGEWNEKLAPILKMKKSTRPGDMERAINRALNYVQAHQMRTMVTRTLKVLLDFTEDQIRARINEEDGTLEITAPELEKAAKAIRRKPSSFSRVLADLSSALEKCHSMSYMAISDTVRERSTRKEEDSGSASAAMHARIAEAMSSAKVDTSARAKLFDGQLQVAAVAKQQQRQAELNHVVSNPEHPNDNDDH